MRADILLRAVSVGLDIVEADIAGAAGGHGRRTALLCGLMGRKLGFSDPALISLVVCGLLHDSALTQWLARNNNSPEDHCLIGQQNTQALPLPSDNTGFITFHHENADGTGYFGKTSGTYPFCAEIIGMADRLDVEWDLSTIDSTAFLRRKLDGDKRFSSAAKELMLAALEDNLGLLRSEQAADAWRQIIPPWNVEYKDSYGLAGYCMQIIDYKSKFTARHSSGIAHKSRIMSQFYGYGENETAKLYLAAALHDLGKLSIPSAILEKPGQLTDDEFAVIQSHAKGTHSILAEAEGFDDIRAWAGNHHEKLDGKGYPLGLEAAALDFNSRLMACLDIYQAVSEERPYHPARSHEDTMKILYAMAGFIDPVIVRDLDKVLGADPPSLLEAIPTAILVDK